MFDNMINQNLYIQEVVDSESKKHYLVHIYFSVANIGPLSGFHCAEFYITDKNPQHNVLVNYGRKAFAPEEIEEFKEREITEILGKLILEKLPDGIKRYEAIMSHGIAGNELKD